MAANSNALRVSRREFLQVGAMGTVGLLTTADPTSADNIHSGLPTFFFRARRGRDLVDLELRFINFTTQEDELVALGGGESKIVVRFPPQHLAEAAFTDPDPYSELKVIPVAKGMMMGYEEPIAACHAPVESYLSGPSWVVFNVPDLTRLPLRESVCECDTCEGDCQEASAHTTAPVEQKSAAKSTIRSVCPRCCRVPQSALDRWFQMMGDWKVRIPIGANTEGSPESPIPVTIPAEDETCIEIPFRLMIAPSDEDTRVLTSSEPLFYDSIDHREKKQTFDLWHAAIRSRKKIIPAQPPKALADLIKDNPDLAAPTRINLQARAVYSPDYVEGGSPEFELYYPDSRELSLRAVSRHLLVDQMAHGDGIIDIENLVLTALGGDATLSYTTSKTYEEMLNAQTSGGSAMPTGADVNEPWVHKPSKNAKEEEKKKFMGSQTLAVWRHRIVLGRDTFYVQAFYVFGMPFLIPSMYVEVTQRTTAAIRKGWTIGNDDPHGPPGAFLLTRRYILIQNPMRQFPDANSTLGRMMPLKKVVLEELRSPFIRRPRPLSVGVNTSLDPYAHELSAKYDPVNPGLYFIPRRLSDDQPVRWKTMFEDGAGKQSRSDSPCLLFASNVVDGQKLWQLLNPEFREWSIPAQDICYAPQRPEIIVRTDRASKMQSLARDDSSGASGTKRTSTDGRSIVNDVLLAHPLREVERKAARVVGDALRAWIATISDIGQQIATLKRFATATFDDLKTHSDFAALRDKFLGSTRVLQPEDPASIEQLTGILDETIQAIGNAAIEIENSVDQKAAAIQDLLRQLERCEQVSTALETHMLKFDCFVVNELFRSLDSVRQNILNINLTGLSKADFVDRVLAEFRGIPGIDINLKNRIESQITTLKSHAVGSVEEAKAVVLKCIDDLRTLQNIAKAQGTEIFQAALNDAKVVIPALKALAGQSAARSIALVEDYALQGITQVRNGVFAKLNQALDEGKAMADQIKTGLAAPAAVVQGIARDVGAIVAEGGNAFDEYARPLSDLGLDVKNAIPDAKLFGVIPLRALVGLVAKGLLPKMQLQKFPEYHENIWEWLVPLQPRYELPPLQMIVAAGDPKVRLRIQLRTRIDFGKPKEIIAGKRPQARVTLDGYMGRWDELSKKPVGNDEAFRVVLANLIAAKFKNLRVEANYLVGEDVKPKITPGFLGVDFLGPLKFVSDLQQYLKFGNVFTIHINPTEIGVRFAPQIPPFSFGVFSLQNIRLGIGLFLPLEMKALRFEFSFCTWEKPFELTVMCLGGRGYFTAALQSDGLRELQGAVEFGGALSFSVAVASGGLYIMAGAYFRIDNSSTVLAGYIRAGGYLDVLGLITASVEFLLMLAYQHSGTENRLYGIARVTINVHIIFVIDIDVTVEMEKTILGSKDSSQSNEVSINDLRQSDRLQFVGSGNHRARLLPATFIKSSADTSTSAVANDSPKVDCYFTRQFGKHTGRFEWDVRSWNSEYWSHFDFACI